mmetsp:Transcript_3253/g.5966  ORF Transcript_3253/g.5966 Transcript_3253/m.5966 type:complete len:265 (+) Transcript_3253:447-1241(+)
MASGPKFRWLLGGRRHVISSVFRRLWLSFIVSFSLLDISALLAGVAVSSACLKYFPVGLSWLSVVVCPTWWVSESSCGWSSCISPVGGVLSSSSCLLWSLLGCLPFSVAVFGWISSSSSSSSESSSPSSSSSVPSSSLSSSSSSLLSSSSSSSSSSDASLSSSLWSFGSAAAVMLSPSLVSSSESSGSSCMCSPIVSESAFAARWWPSHFIGPTCTPWPGAPSLACLSWLSMCRRLRVDVVSWCVQWSRRCSLLSVCPVRVVGS